MENYFSNTYLEKSAESWNLPLSMIVFLENVTKQNESGRVYPWNYLRKMINEIYREYII